MFLPLMLLHIYYALTALHLLESDDFETFLNLDWSNIMHSSKIKPVYTVVEANLLYHNLYCKILCPFLQNTSFLFCL